MKDRRPIVRCLVGILVASWVATASAQVVNPLRGHVKSVDPAAKTLIVTPSEAGEDVPISVGPRTPVLTTANKALTLEDLMTGDGVVVTHLGGVASRIVVNPAPLIGVVESVDPVAKRLVVKQAETDAKRTIQLGDPVEVVTAEDKALEVGDLREGALVAITRDGPVARKIVVRPKPAELTGHVKSIAADYSTFVLTETGTKTDVTVAVDKDTTIATTEGKDLSMKDLKEGDGVGLTHLSSLAKKIVVNVKPPDR